MYLDLRMLFVLEIMTQILRKKYGYLQKKNNNVDDIIVKHKQYNLMTANEIYTKFCNILHNVFQK